MGYKSKSKCNAVVLQLLSYCTAGLLHINIQIDSLFLTPNHTRHTQVRTGQKAPLFRAVSADEEPWCRNNLCYWAARLATNTSQALTCPTVPREFPPVECSTLTFIAFISLIIRISTRVGRCFDFTVSLIFKKLFKNKNAAKNETKQKRPPISNKPSTTQHVILGQAAAPRCCLKRSLTEGDGKQRTQTELPLKSTKCSSTQLSITCVPVALVRMWESTVLSCLLKHCYVNLSVVYFQWGGKHVSQHSQCKKKREKHEKLFYFILSVDWAVGNFLKCLVICEFVWLTFFHQRYPAMLCKSKRIIHSIICLYIGWWLFLVCCL